MLLDGADGAGTAAWDAVTRELEAFVRVVRYDRAGYGWSDSAPVPLTADDSAQDLHAALAHVGLQGPFLLVGHDHGASVLRLFAHRYRGAVVGMVLLDARPESFAALAPPSWRRNVRRARRRLALLALLARLRAPGATRPSSATSWAASGTAGERYVRCTGGRSGAVARYGEALLLEESDREVAALPALGDLPLLVITHERPDLFAGLPAGDAAQAEELWRRLQAGIAGATRDGRLWIADGAGHDVAFERPDMVVQAVREVLAAARARPPGTT